MYLDVVAFLVENLLEDVVVDFVDHSATVTYLPTCVYAVGSVL